VTSDGDDEGDEERDRDPESGAAGGTAGRTASVDAGTLSPVGDGGAGQSAVAVADEGATGDGPPDPETLQAALEAMADPDCRRVAAALDEPLTAKAVAEACDLPRTTAYRKLDRLSEGGLVDERVAVRADGHHATSYVRDFGGLLVAFDGEAGFAVDLLPSPKGEDDADDGTSPEARAGDEPEARAGDEPEARAGDEPDEDGDEDGAATDTGGGTADGHGRERAESPEERLARYWTEVSEEL
jgi:hypothetical protein